MDIASRIIKRLPKASGDTGANPPPAATVAAAFGAANANDAKPGIFVNTNAMTPCTYLVASDGTAWGYVALTACP